jgi:two-component system response regulator YesN
LDIIKYYVLHSLKRRWFGMYKLLIVEDNCDLIEGIKALIDWKANEIDLCGTAPNGILGLQLAQELKPDILITDIRMPLMSGLELLERLNEDKIKLKTIILSGYDDFCYAQKAIRYGAVDYLLKPCRAQEILGAVLKAIQEIKNEHYNDKLIENIQNHIEKKTALNEQDEIYKRDNKKRKMFVESAINYIKLNYAAEISLQKVAEAIYITPGYLSSLFKQELDINFVDYIHKYRIQKAMELLKDIHYKNYEVANMVGYSDEKYFYQMFKKYYGITPNEYRKILSK